LLSADWEPAETEKIGTAVDEAIARGVNVRHQLEKFRNRMASSGKRSCDWDSEWHTCLITAFVDEQRGNGDVRRGRGRGRGEAEAEWEAAAEQSARRHAAKPLPDPCDRCGETTYGRPCGSCAERAESAAPTRRPTRRPQDIRVGQVQPLDPSEYPEPNMPDGEIWLGEGE
jgi:hypothetical protein